tara:strand:- start:530 stop:1309 length:780 start_codon:yes stop_codon:yes gene_type:complete
MNTKKKIAIITGGCGLFGRLQIKALEEINYKVLVLDKDKKKIIKLKSNKEFKHVDFFSCDITQYEEILRIKDKIFKKYKNIHVLVNNAANDTVPKKKQKSRSTFYGLDIGDLKKDLNVGLIGAVYNSKVFGEQMVKNKYGIILNISSDLSIIAPDQRLYAHLGITKPVSYSITKHGLTGLTKYLAAYWAKQNIRVNSFSPGGIYNNQDKQFVKKIKNLIPMGRMANKNDYKKTIQFLCSDASSYITGQNIVSDGGRSII